MWPRPVSVEAAVIDRGEVRQELGEEGRVRIRDVYTLSTPVGGLLQRLGLHAGDRVRTGDVVATVIPASPTLLDARSEKEANAAVAGARSALRAAEADAQLAQTENDRTSQLFSRGFAAKAALDRTQSVLAAANAAVSQRKADLERALAMISRPAPRSKKIEIRSPSSGRILQVLQENETTVSPGAAILEVGDPAKIEIVAEYISQDAAQMREGACAVVDTGGGALLKARVKTVEPFARTKVSALGVEEQRVNVILSLDDGAVTAARLGHGYRVDVRVILFEQKDVLRVPTDALVRKGSGGWAVYRIADGRAKLTPVGVGEGDDRFREVREGLQEGDQVVLFPGSRVSDGDSVRRSP
jgi:HlyD family secretion protein